ncbi:MAG: Spy/CpxP family protein refolding chaperone [Tagaea sp.]|nr:Spy/CpxP family protein refolding chaperone [Magnetospirillum sp.]
MKKFIVPALAALALFAPALAMAQPGPERGDRGDRGQRMFERMCADADARIASRLAYVEAKVKPTAAQRGAWDAFARDSREAARPMRALCDNPPAAAAEGDAAAGLARRERFVTAMGQSLAILRPAVERFQTALDAAQKTALAEALTPGHGRHFR